MREPERPTPWYMHLIPSWPNTWPACVFGTFVVAFVVGFASLLIYDPRAQEGVEGIYGYFDSNGKLGISVEHVFQFTTASYLTKYDLADAMEGPGDLATKLEAIRTKMPWYYVVDPDAACMDVNSRFPAKCMGAQVTAFEQRLQELKLEHKIQGYEVYESVGSGTHALKRGLTWQLTVPHDSTFSRDDIIDLYVRFWGRQDNIYVEDLRIPKSLWSALR